MDVSVLEDAIRTNIGDITFQEAFEKTGKVLNVPVASTKKFEFPRTLNYLTSPNVVILTFLRILKKS
jgi:TAG lipase/lysophosphatidylethanolamine acyltransferase